MSGFRAPAWAWLVTALAAALFLSLSFVPFVRPSHSTKRSSSSSCNLAPRSRISRVTTRHRSGLKRAALTRSMAWHEVHDRFSSASASGSVKNVVTSRATYVRGNGFVVGPKRTSSQSSSRARSFSASGAF